ncbi:Uncharacterised protein [Clostridium baratii]|nr:hypothetical protein [Clostridium baratii]CUP05537.1 Uncharacterised protein [Clostridium baratii]
MGWVNDPKRAAYNKLYNKTIVSLVDIVGSLLIIFIMFILFLIIF